MHFEATAEVAAALSSGRPVVALESTIFSHLGLPSPANAEALDRCIALSPATRMSVPWRISVPPARAKPSAARITGLVGR